MMLGFGPCKEFVPNVGWMEVVVQWDWVSVRTDCPFNLESGKDGRNRDEYLSDRSDTNYQLEI